MQPQQGQGGDTRMSVYNDKDEGYTAAFVVLFGGFIAGLLLALLIFIGSYQDLQLVKELSLCDGIVFLLIVACVVSFVRWRQVNRRRQATVQGNQSLVPLASLQLTPDEHALTLPFTLQLQPNWRAYRGAFALWIIFYVGTSILERSNSWPQILGSDPVHLIIFLVIFPAVIVGGAVRRCPKLQVTPEALKIGPTTLRWSEARLFALRGWGHPGDRARQFELSAPKEALVWKYLRPHCWTSFYQSPMPLDTYEQHMTRLLEYITARTGLPLYDVR